VSGRRLDRRASVTAQIAAAERAAETLQPAHSRMLDDPFSRHFVYHPVLRACLSSRLAASAFIRVLDGACPGFHAFIVARVLYADDACEAAKTDGINQLVLLGAGFDTTSLRASESSLTVFEVDAPSTLAEKRTIHERLQPSREGGETVWVACDFEKDLLRDQLLSAGFDPAKPSLIVWMGVSYYLTRSAIETTIANLAVLCAPGSRLIFDYMDADVVSQTSKWKGARRIARAVERSGEPFCTGFAATDVDTLLAAHGFACEEKVRAPHLVGRYASKKTVAPDDWLAVACGRRI
jgi:methyltransferase (TIGR00027 family)